MDPALAASWRFIRQATAAIGAMLGTGRSETGLPGARAIRAAVELQFGIRATRVRSIHSRENGVWRIDSPQDSWVAKAYPATATLERVQRELRLYRWLSSRDVSVPQYRSRLLGGEIARLEENDLRTLLVLMRYEPLTHLRPATCDQESIAGIGREIATAHAKLQDYPDACELTPDLYGIDAPDAVYQPRGSFNALQASELGKSFRRSEMAEIKVIADRAEQYLAQEELPANLTRSVIHGDLYLANISPRPNGRAFLFDWEAIHAPVAVDLATLNVDLYTAQNVSFARWKILRQWLLEAYANGINLNASDRRSVPLFTLRNLLELARIYCEPSACFARKTDVVKRCYQLADYLLRESPDTRDMP